MARGHLNKNWFRTHLATKSGGKHAPFVDWLCGTGAMITEGMDAGRRDRGTFRRYDADHSGTIEMDELQVAVDTYIAYSALPSSPKKRAPSPTRNESGTTPLTVGFTRTDYRKLRGQTPPVGALRTYAGLSASCR